MCTLYPQSSAHSTHSAHLLIPRHSPLIRTACPALHSPFSPMQVGGLGDVVTALGRAVQEQGHLVEVIIPR